jgi:hypothetical protein
MKPFLFVARIVFAWCVFFAFVMAGWGILFGEKGRFPILVLIMGILMVVIVVRSISHVRRVRFMADNPDAIELGSRHRRRIEIPLPSGEAFDLVDAAIRELPYVDTVDSTRDSLQIFARARRVDPYLAGKHGRRVATGAAGARRKPHPRDDPAG